SRTLSARPVHWRCACSGAELARGEAHHHGGAVPAGTGARPRGTPRRRQDERRARPDRGDRQPHRRQRHDRIEPGGARDTRRLHAARRRPPPGPSVPACLPLKTWRYDPLKDFTPIVAAVEPVTCLAVNSAVPVNTVEELIAYAKARPDELSYGSSGVGSVFQMMGELFNQTAGVRIKHVPYRGVAPAMQDVIAGHIPMVF